MTIKKYLAKTENEAIEMAKKDLGSNAIVMNIKKVHPKGLARLFMGSKVEVTAALEENPVAPANTPQKEEHAIDIELPKEVPGVDIKESEKSIQDKLMKLQLLLEKQAKENAGEQPEKKVLAPESSAAAATEMETEPKKDEEDKQEEKEDKLAAYMKLIHQQLIQSEVDSEIADSILDEVSRSLPADAPLDQILARVYQKIILMIGQPYVIDSEKTNTTQFIFFLGSTGVGKTTTIAKIASKLKLEKNANIALVTADTYRIAAVEQLKTYANILSVPLKVIYSPDELGAMREELEEYDICLIDTAGRSHKNKDQIEDIRKLLEQVPITDRQVYLVLNAGTKYNDLKEIASTYEKLTDYSIVFTKLDETSSSGVMLNLKMLTKCPLSYVTWGQNVPDDMGEVDAQKIAKELLSGNLDSE